MLMVRQLHGGLVSYCQHPAIMSWLMSIGKWSWLCSLVLRAFAECEVTRFRMQCAEVSAFVDQSTRCNMLNYGGANIVLDC